MISNYSRFQECVCCSSVNIHKIGNIQYGDQAFFSNNVIDLELIPELWRCDQCQSAFVQNVVPENVAVALYSKGNAGDRWSQASITEQKTQEVIDVLSRHFQPGLQVLDIGCNTGELLDFAKSKGCVTAGVEFSDASRVELKEKGHDAYFSVSEIENWRFNVVTAFDLVEHLYDVKTFFDSCKDVLAEDGIFIILTGNINSLSSRICKSRWWYARYPEHIVFPSIKFFSDYSGFDLVQWIPTYAARGYRNSLWRTLSGFFRYTLTGRYAGLPSLGPDHALIVLKKKSG